MKETDNTQQKAATERHIELLVHALESAVQNDNIWMNAKGKTAPLFYPKGVMLSAFNSLTLALHSDENGYETNQYTLFNEARKRGESVLSKEKGVPFYWYNWNNYVNKHNPDDKITRAEYLKLPLEEQELYKGIKNREIRTLFNIQQTTFPMVDKKGYAKELSYHGTSNDRGNLSKEERALHSSFKQMVELCKKNLVHIRRDGSGIAHYDYNKDAIYLPDQKNFSNYHDYVREVLRQLVTSTGHQQRLAREGTVRQDSLRPSEDEIKQERLVTELAAGVKCLELGIPAKLSDESLKMTDYWIRELKENPKLIESIEADINNSMDMIHKAERNETIISSTEKNNQKISELKDELPKHFYVTNEIKTLPDKYTKEFVLVKDIRNKTADVIMPAGASLEVDNEIPGMNKQRIGLALKKEGFENVNFFNIDGALGYHHDDRYFEGKDISVNKLMRWNIDELTRLDVSDAVNRANSIDFEKVLMLKDDDGKWALFLKPEKEKSFSIYPEKADINQFFTTLKQGREEVTDQLRQELANKYYMLAQNHPELKTDPFKSSNTDIDTSLIERVNVFKTKPDAKNGTSKILCLPSITGISKIAPREITPQQWQRMWLADDKQAYKVQLAATLFADVLNRQNKLENNKEDDNKSLNENMKKEEENRKEQEEIQKQKEQEEKKKKEEQQKKEEERKFIARFLALKELHKGVLLLFRAGTFYEMFSKDAEKASGILGLDLETEKITKGKKEEDISKISFPHSMLDTYLPKLIRAGERVAITDKFEEQSQKNGISKNVSEDLAGSNYKR